MILQWDAGQATLSPSADSSGAASTPVLAAADRWQFDLWRAMRDVIGEPSPPARERVAVGPAPDAVMVAGLQVLSPHQIAILERLAAMPSASGVPCDVQVLLVHPSPALREPWAKSPEAPPRSPGLAPLRGESLPTATIDPLVDAWLRGTREMQWLLASQGHDPVHATAQPSGLPGSDATLLEWLQHTVACGHVAIPATSETDPDNSIRIHRCHDLGRQAEVLHDAILHAFREIEGLAPHDVVIVSPQIAQLAPHLEAVFNRLVKGGSADGREAEITLPLIVADRGIREVSRGAELLAAIIELVGSRYSVDGLLGVAAHPLVLEHFGLGDDDVEDWRQCIARTKIRWGLDGPRRTSLDRADLTAHTWRLGLERAILGAVIPDGLPVPLLGDVVPLAQVDPAEIASLARLVTLFRIIDDLDQNSREPRPVAAWCDILEAALVALAGEENDELLVPMGELDSLRKSAATAKGRAPHDVSVPWPDVKAILAARLVSAVGRQPLRTGMITATSMIPLRGVPFRVVCVAGFDDAAVSPRDRDGDDLVDRQDLLSDSDSRLDVRRALLDCVLAAKDRVIITCTGMDVKNNATLPLATPLAEWTDFVDRHGVQRLERQGEMHCGIEVFHPRHACSRRNFVTGQDSFVPGDVAWSHDAAALAAAATLGSEPSAAAMPGTGISPPTHVELESLAAFMHDPLWPYVKKTLGITTWRDAEVSTPATIPLTLDTFERHNLRNDYIEALLSTDDPTSFTKAWAGAAKVNGDVPILGFGDDAIAEISLFAESLLNEAAKRNVPLGAGTAEPVNLTLGDVRLSGAIERWYPDQGTIVLVRPDASDSQSNAFQRAKALAAVSLLAVRASGTVVEQALILSQKEGWYPGKTDRRGRFEDAAQIRVVKLADDIDAGRAEALLASLCSLYQEAAVAPRGAFDKTASTIVADLDAARDAFNSFTSGSDFAKSLEAVVYGRQPDFDAVFKPEEAAARAFFEQFLRVTTITYARPNYLYTPA